MSKANAELDNEADDAGMADDAGIKSSDDTGVESVVTPRRRKTLTGPDTSSKRSILSAI